MFVKLVVLACICSAALAVYNGPLAGGQPAHLYPAGVDPAACPNFPNCNNPAVAVNQVPANAWNGPQPQQNWNPAPQPQWNAPQPQWNQQPAWNAPQPQWNGNQNNLDQGHYTGDGDWHGEGLAEAGAFGDISHNFYDPAPGEVRAPVAPPPAPYPVPGIPAQLPAGVNPQACPNYPYCH